MSLKDLNNVLVTVPTLEYHNKNWSWTDMLMEVKRDYKNAIVHQVGQASRPDRTHLLAGISVLLALWHTTLLREITSSL